MVRRRRRRMRKRSATVVPSSAREGSGQFMDFASVGMGVEAADKQRAQEDVEVERDGPVLDVVKVVLHPVLHLLDRVSFAAEAVSFIGRASCWQTVFQYVWFPVYA